MVRESLRLFPPLLGGRRVAARDTALGGRSLAAGTPVLYVAQVGGDFLAGGIIGLGRSPSAVIKGKNRREFKA